MTFTHGEYQGRHWQEETQPRLLSREQKGLPGAGQPPLEELGLPAAITHEEKEEFGGVESEKNVSRDSYGDVRPEAADLRKMLGDYGTLDDLTSLQRDAYVRHVLPLAGAASRFLLWCFEWELRFEERLLTSIMPFGKLALAPGEVELRFGQDFAIESIGAEHNLRGWPRGWAAYLMHHRSRLAPAAPLERSC